MKPVFIFDDLVNKISILEEDIDCLFQSTFLDVINQVFSRTMYNRSSNDDLVPIFAFVQKSGVFYIYENDEIKWIEFSKKRMVRFLDKVYMKISREFSSWKKRNKGKIEDDKKLQLLCDKTSVKLYSVDVRMEPTLGKIRTNMFSKMKNDMKSLVEYEFEF
jgi:hypothetical protein